MKVIAKAGGTWWSFPLALLISLILITVIAAGSVRAETGASSAGTAPTSVMNLGGLFLPAAEGGRVRPAPFLGTDIQVEVSGLIARTRITQHFKNPADVWTEAIYTHPLPPSSAVDRLRMNIGARVINGRIQERSAARRQYTVAKRSGRRASLVEQQRPNIFTTAVANLGPGETVSITIEFQERLVFRDGQFTLRFPLVVGPRYIPGSAVPINFDDRREAGADGNVGGSLARGRAQVPDADRITPPLREQSQAIGNPVTLQVSIAAGFNIGSLMSPSHDITIERQEGGYAQLRLAGDAQPADRDFVLRWGPATGDLPQAGFFWEKVDDARYGLLMVMPPVSGGRGLNLPPRPARDVVFVVDTSGSMHGPSLDQAKQSLILALDRLTPQDRFHLLRFSNTVSGMPGGLSQVTPDAVRQAKMSIAGLSASGGTEIVPALRAALNSWRAIPQIIPSDETRLRQVVLITDGAVGNEDQLLALINNHLGRARLFTVGIGSAPNGFLMSRAARAGRGTHTFIQSPTEVAERMAELFLKLESPALTDVALTWTGQSDSGKPAIDASTKPLVWPNPLPDLYAGEPLVALVRINGGGPQLRVSGRIADRIWEQSVTIADGANHKGVAGLWAREKLRQLMADLRRGTSARTGNDTAQMRDAIRAEIVATALKFGLVSKFTSLVAIDSDIVRPLAAAQRTSIVPANLPDGWRRDDIGGDRPAGVVPGSPAGETDPNNTTPGKVVAPKPVPVGLRRDLAFDRTDPALNVHLAAAVAGTPLMAMPKTATPAQAYMALGVLFLIAAIAIMVMGWKEPGAGQRSKGWRSQGRPVADDWIPGDD